MAVNRVRENVQPALTRYFLIVLSGVERLLNAGWLHQENLEHICIIHQGECTFQNFMRP